MKEWHMRVVVIFAVFLLGCLWFVLIHDIADEKKAYREWCESKGGVVVSWRCFKRDSEIVKEK